MKSAYEGLWITNLSFTRLRAANLERQTHYPPYRWGLDEWVVSVGGEVGEALNLVKKLIRARDGLPGNTTSDADLVAALGDELADATIYLDLLMSCGSLSFMPGLRYDAGLADAALIAEVAFADAPESFGIVQLARDALRCAGELATAVAEEDKAALQECGDTLLAEMIALATYAGVDLGAAIVGKFNATSVKLGATR